MGKDQKLNDVTEPKVKKFKPGQRKVLVSGAGYHNFEENPIFKGTFLNDVNDEEGVLVGFNFVDTDGEEQIITNAFAINKALQTQLEEGMVKDLNLVLQITWKGKIELAASGRSYNKFEVEIIA